MIITPLTQEAIEQVFEDPWESGIMSAEAKGVSIDEEKEFFIKMIGKPFTGAAYAEKNGPCCAVCAGSSPELNILRVDFMASKKGWTELWLPLSRFFSQFSSDLLGHFEQIEAYSGSGVGKVFNWYKAIGFSWNSQTGNIHKYIKTRR